MNMLIGVGVFRCDDFGCRTFLFFRKEFDYGIFDSSHYIRKA